MVGPFVDWGNGKSLLQDQANFTPSDITCELIKRLDKFRIDVDENRRR